MKYSNHYVCIALLTLVGLASGCSRESDNGVATDPSLNSSASVSDNPAPANESDDGDPNAIARSTNASKSSDSSGQSGEIGTWIIAPEDSPFLDRESDEEETYLTTDNGVAHIRLPRSAADQHVILNQPLSDDFEVKVRLRWPDWETSRSSPHIKFGLCDDQGQMQRFPKMASFFGEPKEHYEFSIRCSGGGVGMTFDSGREQTRAREFDGQTYFAFAVDAPAVLEIVEQSISYGPHEIKFQPKRTVTGSNAAGRMPPGMMPPGMNGNTTPAGIGNTAAPSQTPTEVVEQGQPFAPKNFHMPSPVAGPVDLDSTPWRLFAGQGSANPAQAVRDVKWTGEHCKIEKAITSPDFWLMRQMPEGDWNATLSFDLPPITQLRSQAVPGIIGIGVYTSDFKKGLMRIAPNPDPVSSRRVTWSVRRRGDRITFQIDGEPSDPTGQSMEGESELGFFVSGMISFHFDVTELSGPAFDSAQPAEAPTDTVTEDADAKPSATRIWSDSTGKFQVEATFVAMESDVVILKKADGKLAKVPLERLSKTDQETARLLAKEGMSD